MADAVEVPAAARRLLAGWSGWGHGAIAAWHAHAHTCMHSAAARSAVLRRPSWQYACSCTSKRTQQRDAGAHPATAPPLAGCPPPRPFVQEMAEAARLVEPRLPEFQPWEVSVLLWGAARLGYQPSPAQAVALQARVAELAQQQPDSPGTLTAQVGGRWSPTALPGCGGCAGRRAGCIV